MVQPLSYNDGVLFASLVYSCLDLHWEWESFQGCSKPVHHWLLASYGTVIAFRLVHLLGTRVADPAAIEGDEHGDPSGRFLLDLRQKGFAPRMLSLFTWSVALPFFMAWTYIGTSWLRDVVRYTPQCMPSDTHLWFAGLWLLLCYVWILVHVALGAVAWVLERRVRRAEGDLRAIEDDDVVSRWGQVSRLDGFHALEGGGGLAKAGGLTPEEIIALPCETELGCCTEASDAAECPICICELRRGDAVRRLPGCGHAFHKSCIDLWLLRRADCPLCKRGVLRGSDARGGGRDPQTIEV